MIHSKLVTLGYCVMVKHHCKWIWIPLIILSILTIIECKRHHKRAFNLLHNFKHQQEQQQYIISQENQQVLTSNSILIPNERYLNVNAFEDTIMMTATTSVLGIKQIVKEKTLLDLEKPTFFNDMEELSNETHIRVKRTDSEFDKSDDNHRESLIFMKNNYLDDLANSFPRKSSIVEYQSVRKRQVEKDSNEYYNNSDYRNVSSDSNKTFDNLQITERNRYLDNNITDSILSNIRFNNVENKVGVYDSISNLTEIDNKRFKRENKSKKNIRRRVVKNGKKRKLKKYSDSSNGKRKQTNKRHSKLLKTISPFKRKRKNYIRNNYNIESKIEKKDSNKDESQIDMHKKKDISDNKKSFREKNNNEQVEETLINEDKDVILNDSVRGKRSLHKRNDILPWSSKIRKFRSKRNGRKDLTIEKYPNVYETSSSSSLSMLSDNKLLNEKPRGDRAVKSIEEIKELAEKLVTKVNELQSYLSYENAKYNNGEDKSKKVKKKLESREVEVPKNNATIEEEVVLETPKLVDECVRIGDLSSALKTLDDKNATLENITMKDESKTERMNLLNDRMNPLTNRIVRDNQNKRKSRRKWGRWTGWSSCSVTCGKGRQIRWRHCLRDCSTVETEMEEKACQMTACPPGKFLGIF
ncbi:hypothetical protein M0802_009467 [Mischocyttarus mexicanus]|nr:hypothetical protein M0802_009467 [Mischocyttarus mexicanus]